MNLMGKILTLLILIMSVVFLVIAVMVGASHKGWKTVAEENREKANRAQNLLNESKAGQTEKDRLLRTEQVARQQQLSQLFSQLTTLTDARDRVVADFQEQQIIAQRAMENLRQAESRLEQQGRELDELKVNNRRLIDEVATKRKEVVELTNQINDITMRLESIEVDNRGLNERIARQARVMNALGVTEYELTSSIPPSVEGIVTRVDNDLITISLGSDDGVRTGHTFDIYRQNRFVGKAEIINAEENISVAKIKPEFQQSVVLKGDYVTTKF